MAAKGGRSLDCAPKGQRIGSTGSSMIPVVGSHSSWHCFLTTWDGAVVLLPVVLGVVLGVVVVVVEGNDDNDDNDDW